MAEVIVPNSIEELMRLHPKPWGVTNEGGEVALNETGFNALGQVVLLHDGCVDDEAVELMMHYGATNNAGGYLSELAKGAKKFIDNHNLRGISGKAAEEASCVPGLNKGCVLTLMGLFQITCEARAKAELQVA